MVFVTYDVFIYNSLIKQGGGDDFIFTLLELLLRNYLESFKLLNNNQLITIQPDFIRDFLTHFNPDKLS